MTNLTRRDIYQEVTDRIVEALEAGTRPWEPRFDPAKAGGPMSPMNAVTGNAYRGVNTLILGMSPLAFASGDPRWATYKQAKDAGWQVRGGSKATGIVFYKPLERGEQPDDGQAQDGPAGRMMFVLKAFSVFHASQIDGMPEYRPPSVAEAPWRRPEAVADILASSRAKVLTGGDKAFYSPGTDHIQLPPDSAFRSPEAWSGTAMHELVHWTGHPSRLDRNLKGKFGSAAYAMEELRAEMGSAFVGATVGVAPRFGENAAYMASWLKALKDDKREVFRAAADGQRAADFVLAFEPAYSRTMQPVAEQIGPRRNAAPAPAMA